MSIKDNCELAIFCPKMRTDKIFLLETNQKTRQRIFVGDSKATDNEEIMIKKDLMMSMNKLNKGSKFDFYL